MAGTASYYHFRHTGYNPARTYVSHFYSLFDDKVTSIDAPNSFDLTDTVWDFAGARDVV